jgi:hypothetical protein
MQNSLKNWIQWNRLNEKEILNLLSDQCYAFSDNCVGVDDVSEQSQNECVLWLEENRHLIGV